MLKHEKIISSLSEAQKIKLLTDIKVIESGELAYLGIPKIKIGYTDEYMKALFPQKTSLIQSFNIELWHEVAEAVSRKMAQDGVSFAISHGPKVKFSPFRKELSEDGYLAECFSYTFAKAIADKGIGVGLSGFYLSESDASHMDIIPNERVIRENLTFRFESAAKKSGAIAFISDARTLTDNYENVNERLQKGEFSNESIAKKYVICPKVSSEKTVRAISNGVICMRASEAALTNAISRHKKITEEIASAISTESTLEEEIRSGSAISPDTISEALDRLIDFLDECKIKDAPNSEMPSAYDFLEEEEIALRAALESVVLLKNDNNLLPLEDYREIRIIGDIAMHSEGDTPSLAEQCKGAFTSRGFSCTDTIRGYDSSKERDVLPRQIKPLSLYGGIYVVFLGFEKGAGKRIAALEKLTLPANQIALTESLVKHGEKVVAVIPDGYAVDTEFASSFAALISAPLDAKYSAEALVQIITGEVSPSGRLAYSFFDRIDEESRKSHIYKAKYGMKTGCFFGYRYYDTASTPVAYPFGHGLSYSKVVYSHLYIKGNSVSFTVTNKGNHYVCETAQVYIGEVSPTVLRPKKELAGFVKTELAPRESKTLTVTVQLPKIYHDNAMVTSSGIYCISVGSSVSAILLEDKRRGGKVRLTPDKEPLSRYFQSVSNISKENYTLEASYSFMDKKVSKNLISAIGAMIISISVGIFNANFYTSTFLSIVSAILALSSIVLFMLEIRDKNQKYEEQQKQIKEKNAKLFANAQPLSEFSAEKMFKDEFDTDPSEITAEKQILVDDFDMDYLNFVNPDLDYKNAVDNLVKFASERGVEIKRSDAEDIFASLSTTKLLVFENLESKKLEKLIFVLTEYFETPAFIDKVDESYTDEEHTLFHFDEEGKTRSNLLAAMERGISEREKIHIAALDGVIPSELSSYFAPYGRYIQNPASASVVKLASDPSKNYYIPKNLWFVINLKEEESVSELPAYILEYASVHHVSISEGEEKTELSHFPKFNYYQLDYLANKLGSKLDISEDKWKKIDKLESYAASHSDYCIGNKAWRSLERQIMILASCARDIQEALDSAICAKLVCPIYTSVNANLGEDDPSVKDVLDNVFGEGNATACHDMIDGFVHFAEAKAKKIAYEESIRRANEEAERKAKEEAERAAKEEAERAAKEEAERAAKEAAERAAKEEAERAAKEEAERAAKEESEKAALEEAKAKEPKEDTADRGASDSSDEANANGDGKASEASDTQE